MKSLSDLWRNSAEELAEWCHTSTTRDFKTVVRRTEKEGTSFLTITLPAFGKAFDNALDEGRLISSSEGFSSFKSRQGLPVFMSGFLSQVFSLGTGEVLREPSIDAIFAVRFLTGLFAKIELPCSNSRVARAMERYVECEQEIEDWESTCSPDLLLEFRRAAQLLYARLLTRVDHLVYLGSIEPTHGPGSTADGLLGNQKFHLRQWTQRLEAVFPYGEYCLASWGDFRLLGRVDFLDPGMERPVKVIPVPKTLKGPRIIAEEPTCMQFMQQGISKALVRELENPKEIVSSLLGFTDQIPNREMAREGSRTGRLSTIDLSEASDRVPNLLVKELLKNHHWLSSGVDACRSTRAEIPKIGVCIPKLRKFASMGSALTFPLEAMVFLTVVVLGIADKRCLPVSEGLITSLSGKVRVYGDDIIVPTDCVEHVINRLEAFGFVVNKDKSFWTGMFRESCGGDYYAGEDVTPIRLKQVIPTSREDGPKVATLVKFRNRLYLRGMWKTARYLDEQIVRLLSHLYPPVHSTSPCLGRLSFLPFEAQRVDENTQAPLVKGWVLVPRIPHNAIYDEVALFKCLTSKQMHEDVKHLERSGRPYVVDIKRRWVTPF